MRRLESSSVTILGRCPDFGSGPFFWSIRHDFQQAALRRYLCGPDSGHRSPERPVAGSWRRRTGYAPRPPGGGASLPSPSRGPRPPKSKRPAARSPGSSHRMRRLAHSSRSIPSLIEVRQPAPNTAIMPSLCRRVPGQAPGESRSGEAGRGQRPLHGRLDHRLLAQPRRRLRRQAGPRQVLRPVEGRELRHRRRHDAGRALSAAERRGQGLQAQGRDADDRHEQHRDETRPRRSPKASARSCSSCSAIFPTRRFCCSASSRAGAATDPVRATLAEINRTISKLHDGTRVHYLDIGAGFLDADGNIPQDVMSDGAAPDGEGLRDLGEGGDRSRCRR